MPSEAVTQRILQWAKLQPGAESMLSLMAEDEFLKWAKSQPAAQALMSLTLTEEAKFSTPTPRTALESPKFSPPPPQIDLLQGWTEYTDASTQKLYYHSATTGETTWVKPTSCASPPPPLPPVANRGKKQVIVRR